jgi:anti-sigma factor RsiW
MNDDRLRCIDPELGDLVPFFAAGRLSAEERRLAAAHLEACALCAHEESAMRDLVHGIAQLRARPDVTAAVDERRARWPRGAAALVAAALLAAAALAVALLPSGQRGAGHTEMRALEARVAQLEEQNALLARTIASERVRDDLSPWAGVRIAMPPNL